MRADTPLAKWLLAYLAIGATALIAAHIAGGDPLVGRILTFVLPVGAVLFSLLQGGKIEAKTDEQTKTLAQVDRAVNGQMKATMKQAVAEVLDERR